MSEITNQLGVALAKQQALQLGWFFRSQEESDQGIDAHVEKVEITQTPGKPDREVGTGRLIAVQIKTGPSYFEKPSPDGWWFSFDAKKHKLWLDHALPVIVVLVDLAVDQIYWQKISEGTVTSTGKRFKVEVPRAQTVTTADAEWTHIASGLEKEALAKFEKTIGQVPPSVAEVLSERALCEKADAALLTAHLAAGRANPRGTVESLLATSPIWMTRYPVWTWQALGSYAAEHEHFDLSSDAFERAAHSVSAGRGHLLAAAGLNAMHSDRVRAEQLLTEAELTSDARLLVAVGRALLEHPADDAGPRRIPPVIATDSEKVRASGPVQGFLADQALRAGDVSTAERHSSAQLAAEPTSSAVMMQRAEILMRRSNSTSADPDDMPAAIELLTRARAQRILWAGPILELTVTLSQSLLVIGKFDSVLDLSLRDSGTMTSNDIADPRIRRNTIVAAYFSDQPHLVDHLIAHLGDGTADSLLKVRIGLLELSPIEQIALHRSALVEARASLEYHEIANAVIALAALGEDHGDVLRELNARSIVPGEMVELVDALIAAHGDLDLALPTLRALARTDIVASEHLNALLRDAQRYQEAADNARAQFDVTGNPHFLIQQAQNLIDAGAPNAEEVARSAANSTEVQPAERARLHLFLAELSGDRGDWHVAERDLVGALAVGGQSDAAVWRIVIAQLNQGKLNRAAATFAKYRPRIRSLAEARLWLNAHATVRWDEETAAQALTLAEKFDDSELPSECARAVLFATRSSADPETGSDDLPDADGPDIRAFALSEVPSVFHERAFAILSSLNAQGTPTGFVEHQVSADQLPDEIISQLQQRDAITSSLDEVVKSVNASRLPIGALSGLLNKGYATVLIQRLFGALVSGSADDNEHTRDVEDAKQALGTSAVMDASAMLTISGMETGSKLGGQFLELTVPASSMRDIHHASAQIRQLANSPGTLGWDRRTNSPYFAPLSDEEFARMHDRAAKLEQFAEGVPGRVVLAHTLYPELSDAPAHHPWTDVIQLAHDRGVSLWSDDLGLRRYAREHSVACFGTSALIEAVRDRKIAQSVTEAAAEAAAVRAASDNLQLAKDLVVDVPLTREDLLQIAENDLWRAHSGASAISRAAWWCWTETPFEDLRALYEKVRESAPDELSSWQSAAMQGAASAYTDGRHAAAVLAALSLVGFGTDVTVEVVSQGVRRARIAAKANNVDDPLDYLASAATLLPSESVEKFEAVAAEVVTNFREAD